LLPASAKLCLGYRIGALRGVTFLYIFIHAEQRRRASHPATGLLGALLYIRMHLHLHPRCLPTIELWGLFLFLVCVFFLKVGEGEEEKKKHHPLNSSLLLLLKFPLLNFYKPQK